MTEASPAKIPSLFVSHGAPTIVLDQSDAHKFLTKFPDAVPTPTSILVVSAHWETGIPCQRRHPTGNDLRFQGLSRCIVSDDLSRPRRARSGCPHSGAAKQRRHGTGQI